MEHKKLIQAIRPSNAVLSTPTGPFQDFKQFFLGLPEVFCMESTCCHGEPWLIELNVNNPICSHLNVMYWYSKVFDGVLSLGTWSCPPPLVCLTPNGRKGTYTFGQFRGQFPHSPEPAGLPTTRVCHQNMMCTVVRDEKAFKQATLGSFCNYESLYKKMHAAAKLCSLSENVWILLLLDYWIRHQWWGNCSSGQVRCVWP